VHEIALGAGVVERSVLDVDADDVGARLDQQAPRAARDRERRGAVQGPLLDEVTLVVEAVAREELPRLRTGRSAVAVVEDRARHGGR
jgi:hypothetical protein